MESRYGRHGPGETFQGSVVNGKLMLNWVSRSPCLTAELLGTPRGIEGIRSKHRNARE
jgi:hypothetical protein